MTLPDEDPWETPPRDTRERTCGHAIPPIFSVRHTFRLSRDPDPTGVTVTRTYEATVEWTSTLDLPSWLSVVVDELTPYESDRFAPDAPARETSHSDATTDGRFLAAPVEATVRPVGADPVESEPYHYWNTPLARLQIDDAYPDAVVSATIDLVDGPEGLWTGASTAGNIDARSMDGDIEDYTRVGVTVTGRERFQRSTGDDSAVPTDEAAVGDVDGSALAHDDDDTRESSQNAEKGQWDRVGASSAPTLGGLRSIVESTIASRVRDRAEEETEISVDEAVERVAHRIDAAWRAFELGADDEQSLGNQTNYPYRVPDAAVRIGTGFQD